MTYRRSSLVALLHMGGSALAAGMVLASGAAMLTAPAAAQDITSGTLSGKVTNPSGAAVAGASVTVSSNARSVTRTVTSGPDGSFSVPQLPVGTYTINAEKDGVGAVTLTDAVVALGGSSFTVKLEPVDGQTIVVTAARARELDFSQTATGLVIDVQDTFNRVPIARDVAALQLLAPQTTAGDSAFNSVTGGTNVALGGGSVAENIYYVNGMNITNFRNFLGGGTVPFEFYDQVQVKTGGYQAEFGRATGGAVIAVTRSGSNDIKGGINAYWSPSGLRSNAPATFVQDNPRDRRQDYEANFWASGPIIKDHLYFFGFYNPRYKSLFDATVASDGSVTESFAKSTKPFWGGKIDWDIAQGHRLEFTYFNNSDAEVGSITTRKLDGSVPDLVTPYAVETGGDNFIGKYTGNLTDWLTISGLYGNSSFERSSSSTQPYILEGRFGSLVQVAGHPDATLDAGRDRRELFRADIDVIAHFAGEHHLRFGIDREELFSEAAQGYSGGVAYRYYRSGEDTALGGRIPANTDYVRVRNLNAFGSFKARNTALYLQDNWDVTDRLNLSLGIRNETFENRTSSGEIFTKLKNQWGPRLGATYDLFGDNRTKLSAFFGRYHLPVAANTNIRLGGNESFTQDWYFLNSVDPSTQLPTLGGHVLHEVLSDSAGADPRTLVSKNLKPQYMDEFIVGIDHRFDNQLRVGLNVTYRDLKSVLEDTDLGYTIANFCATQTMAGCNAEDTPASYGSGGYILLNPGRDAIIDVDLLGDGNLTEITIPASILDLPKAQRKYWAVEANFDRPWDGRWSLSGSYVWASLKGNYEGGVKSDNGQDDTGLTQDYDEPGWMDGAFGFLPNHRRHTFKLYGAYGVTDNLQIGGFARLQSPRKFGCIGVYDEEAGGPGRATTSSAASWYCGGALVGRGKAFEGEWLKQIDLSVSYNLKIAGIAGLQVRADLFNAFNWKSKLDYYELGEDDGGTPDPNYGKPTSYQAPRSVRFGLSLNF
ncbi:MAG: TonB-dependent receptor [Sphingobium sp.]